MAVRLADAVAYLGTNDDGLKKGLAEGKSQISGWGSMINGALMGVGMAGFNAIAGAAQQAVSYMGDAVAAASDMGETTSKVGVVFGDASAGVLAWAENAALAFGQSKQQALDAASTFAIFGKSAGLSGQDLQNFSQDFVGLASDLASFNNTSPEQAIEAIGAALRGETEPMRAYGVLLDDASMRQKALEMGIISTTKEALTPQQKVLAAQALIYEQTSLAQGDFARTSGGLANQQRILDAQMTNLQTTLGQALMPVMLAFTQGLNDLVMIVMPPLSALLTNSVIPAMTAFGDTLSSLFNYFRLVVDDGDELNDYLADLPEPMQDIVLFIAQNLLPAFQNIVGMFQQNIGPILQTAEGWFTQFGGVVKGMVDTNLNFFRQWIDQNMPRIQQIVQSVLAALTQFWEDHGERITNVVQTLLGFVVNLWETNFRTVLNIVQVALQLLTGDFEGAGQTLRTILNDWRMFFENVIRTITTGIGQWFREVDWGGIGRSILDGIANGIRNGAGSLLNAARDAANGLPDAFKQILGIASPSKVAAEEIGAPFAQGIGVGIRNSLAGLTGDINSGLQGLMGGIQTPAATGAGGGMINITINVSGGDASGAGLAARDGVLSALRSAGLR
jgi:hypothetical protein